MLILIYEIFDCFLYKISNEQKCVFTQKCSTSNLTYEQIKDYVREQTGFRVSTLYISQVKRKCGLEVGESYNKPKSEDARQPQCTPEKEEAIMQALRHYGVI